MKLCECGCGQPTRIASKTKTSRGEVKGQPQRFIHGHAARVIRGSLGERLARGFDRDDSGCWLWSGATTNGYGVIQEGGRQQRAHRVMYEQLVAPIPEGDDLHHTCGKRRCVNPEHLIPLSRSRHKSAHAEAITRCPHGHEYTPENTYMIPGKNQRQCRACKRSADRRYRQRQRGNLDAL
jgi:hypothetical protein